MPFEATITSIQRMTPRVKQFVVEAEETFDFDPGQHTTVRFERDETDDEDEQVVRPYTATNTPGNDRITLAIKRYDDGTASVYMHEREVGDTITLGELGGNLTLRDTDRDVVFVSTGTGITPMMAMLKQYLEVGTGEVHFFYGEKNQENIMYRETLDQLAAEHDELSVIYSLSDEEWAGPTGHVQNHLDDRLDGLDRDFYVCGVPGMVVDTKDELAELDVDDDRVFTEGWEDGEVED
ncbi:ferredoxin--NADP reductase [Halococcus thailandensis]|uniref:Phenol hydroxylase n=1 Tax=Halococcus thailandensis JCM 13552 TaxID=1227457 RepID=M0N248_9EURY|nr:ferredoxin--NADP reductase [Halococcus thailandensis]EMA51583.1 phenol hydroxylase [Halococcus thailandensis JCM 13552]